jgi:hypothetical protein
MDCDSNRPGCRYRCEWLSDNPGFAALISSAPVLAADECHALLQVCAGEQPFPASLKPQRDQEWLRLYTNHRAVTKAVAEVFSEPVIAILQGSHDEIMALLVGDGSTVGGADFLDDSLWRRAFERIEVRFLFRITMPCVLMYGKSPVELLASVGRGGSAEGDNIGKLVALDSLVVTHSRVARMLNSGDTKHCLKRAELLGECLSKPRPNLSKRQVKMMLAALMSRISELLGQRFTEPQIRGLYDAIAKDRGVGIRDPDLPESPEAFSKAIQRHRSCWQLPEQPDTESLAAVRALETLLS